MSADLRELSHRLLDEVWNKRNMDVIDELISPDFVIHDPNYTSGKGPEEYKKFVHTYLTAFPDTALTVQDQVADGSTVATRWTATGTHQGPLNGIPVSGCRVTIEGVSFSKVVDGKFVESWNNWDSLGILRQIGAVPAQSELQAA